MSGARRQGRGIAVLASASLVIAGGIALTSPASGAPSAQPRAGGYQYGNWSAVGAGFANDQVYTIVQDDTGTLFATGTFANSGDDTVNRVAKLTGSTWGNMAVDDSGVDPTVATTPAGNSSPYPPAYPGVYGSALSPSGDLYVGGQFTRINDDTMNNVGRWTGSSWQTMGFGLYNDLSQLTTNANVLENLVVGVDDTNYADDTVYAIGEFTGICTNADCTARTTVSGFAQWTDDTWYVMGSGATTGKVFTGAFKDDTLYVGGTFTQIQGQTINRLAAWRESDDTWVTVGNWQPSQQVAALTVHPTTGDIYAAGYFNDLAGAGGARLSGVARYKVADDTWYPVGDWSTNVDVATLDFDPTGTYLYVGGRFTTVGGTTFNRIATLSGGDFSAAGAVGGTWQYLKSAGVVGVDASVRSLVVNSDGSVYVGGDFSTPPGASPRVALFTPGREPSPYDPVYPADAPTNVVATPGWNKVTVDWTAPTYTGSYPITNYLVQASPGGKVCITRLTDPKLNQCTYTSLTPGTNYTFTVQALNGAGWGDRSAESNVAAAYNLKITSYKRVKQRFLFINLGSKVTVSGSAAGYANGTRITPWVMYNNSGTWEEQKTSGLTSKNGRFSWERKFGRDKNSQTIAVKFSIPPDESNSVFIGPVR